VTRRLALLANPTSGKGRFRGSIDPVAAKLSSGDCSVTLLTGGSALESAEMARRVVAEGYDDLIVMGGDGLVHLALQAIVGSQTALGVIATGSGNDVARALGLPTRRPDEAVDVVLTGSTRLIDVANAAGAYYATVLCSGFDSLVNERANRMTWPTGQMRYNLATLAELRVFRPLNYRLELDGQSRELEAMLVAVGNGPSYGGGLRMCHGAEIDDGMLDVVIIKPVSKLELLKVYPRLFKGTHVTHRAYEHHSVKQITVAAEGIVAYADGERLAPLPMTIDVVPEAVRVYAPPK
jgi:diacylglycerol kinase (ATP)